MRYPINNDDRWEGTFVQFLAATEGSGPLGDGGFGGGGSVTIYAPVGITIPGAVNYSNFGTTGSLSATMFSKIAEGYKGTQEAKRNGDDFLDAIKAGIGVSLDGITAGRAARIAALNAASETAGGVYSLSTGTALNPNTKALFESVDARAFNFTFTMIPTSAAEAVAINSIIKFFRVKLYPRRDGDFLYRFPDKFQIVIHTGGEGSGQGGTWSASSNQLIQTKGVYLTNVDVVYNPNNTAWHIDGNPTETQLTLAFREGETLTAEDVEAGF